MPEYYTEMTNKWFELANDTYRTYVKSLLWTQERTMEYTKMVLGQTEKGQEKTIADEFNSELKRAQNLTQETFQQMYQNSVDVVNQFRAVTNNNVGDLNERIDEIQAKVEATATKNGK